MLHSKSKGRVIEVVDVLVNQHPKLGRTRRLYAGELAVGEPRRVAAMVILAV
jgi:hypothetical protein